MKITMNKFIVRRNPAVQPPTYREIIARLLEEGYVKTRQVGSHARFRNGARLVTVPGMGSKRPKRGTWASIRRQAGWMDVRSNIIDFPRHEEE